LHNHNLFLTLITNTNNIQELIDIVKSIAINSKGLCYYSSSFGFDYIALDTYFDFCSKKNTIRISIGDVSKKVLNDFIDYFKENLNGKI